MTQLHVFFVCTFCDIGVSVLLQIGRFTQSLLFSPFFFGSFGRTGSGEDVSDAGREQGEGDIQSPAEFWTSKIQRVQPGMKVVIGCMPLAHNQVFSDIKYSVMLPVLCTKCWSLGC